MSIPFFTVKSSDTSPELRDALPNREAGQRIRHAIHVARARNTDHTSDTALALAAGVHYDTLMNWFSGKTMPRPFHVRRVAEVLQVPYGDLLAAYEGTAPPDQPLHEAVGELVVELRGFLEAERQARANQDRRIAEALRALASVMSPTIEPVAVMAREKVGNGAHGR